MECEIGNNLKYERLKIIELNDNFIRIQDSSDQIQQIDISEIRKVEIAGVKSNSGFCGSMEWSMSNPTFLLPTNLFYNIINSFKRKKDTIHIKVEFTNGKPVIVIGTQNHFLKLQSLTKKMHKPCLNIIHGYSKTWLIWG